ncbi:MAG: NAD-dependent epimerase/dehydratase family protein [Candidatus Jacksonbacteria bacterium]
MDKNINNILILGGAGFIGSNLTKSFVENNKKVIVFDRKEANWQNIKSVTSKIQIVKGDFDDSETLKKIFNENQIDIVIHLISIIIPGTPFDTKLKNKELVSTINLLEIMAEKGVKNIIYFSSGGAIYGANKKNINNENDQTNPINFYGQLKLTVEKNIQTQHNVFGLNYIILRPSNVYGKNQNIYGKQGIIAVTLGNLIQNKPIEIWGDGKIIRDYIYIDDLCRAILLLIKNNKWNNIYNVGNGKGTSVNKILQIIKAVTKINFDINYKDGRKVDIPVNILDVSKIKKDIDWKSSTKLEKGILTMWEEINKK